MGGLLQEAAPQMPASFVMIGAMSILWFILWNWHFRADSFAWNYEKGVRDGQWWRLITMTFSHIHILHLVFNMAGVFYPIGIMEYQLGTETYLKWTYLMIVLTAALEVSVQYLLITRFGREEQRVNYALGYSGIVFGWFAIYSVTSVYGRDYSFFGLFGLPGWAMPWISLVLTQLIIPNASFLGHLCGIIVGYIVAFVPFEWFDLYLYLCCLSWTVILFVWNVKTHNDGTPYLNWITELNAPGSGANANGDGANGERRAAPLRSIAIVNGSIQRGPSAGPGSPPAFIPVE